MALRDPPRTWGGAPRHPGVIFRTLAGVQPGCHSALPQADMSPALQAGNTRVSVAIVQRSAGMPYSDALGTRSTRTLALRFIVGYQVANVQWPMIHYQLMANIE